MSTTRFCLIRHGETPWNTERRIQGHTDIDLNDNGLAQAAAAGRWLAQAHGREIGRLYSSDLKRAWLTATAIGDALELQPVPEAAFRERRYGDFEGLTYQEAETRFPSEYAAMHRREPGFRIPGGGENLFEFFERISRKLQTLARLHPGETVGIVCHGGVLDIVNRFVRGNPLDTPRDFDIPNAGLNWLDVDLERTPHWRILSWGQTPHLQAGALDELPG